MLKERIGTKDVLTPEECASYLGISRAAVYNLFHSKGFPSFRLNGSMKGSLRVKKIDFEKLLDEQKAKRASRF